MDFSPGRLHPAAGSTACFVHSPNRVLLKFCYTGKPSRQVVSKMTDSRQVHWDRVYGTRASTDLSWYEANPSQSLKEIRAAGLRVTDPIIDVGGGASRLVDELLRAGYLDVTVLDISADVLRKVRERLAHAGAAVDFLQSDVTTFRPSRRFALWHDRAMFHFLVQADDRKRYIEALRQALTPEGQIILATFGPEGPERCSGLEVSRFDADTLSRELGPDFRLLASSLVSHFTPGGAEQQFLYCRFARST
jgi:SAM-dependent methyltransferase